MKLQDFEKLKNSLGMVPMSHVVGMTPYNAGDIAGYSPENALSGWQSGMLALIDKDGKPKKNPNVKEEEADEEEDVPGVTSTRLGLAKDVAIPENWETLSVLKRSKLAGQIAGKPAREIQSDEAAREIIAAEIESRGGLKAAGEPTDGEGQGEGGPGGADTTGGGAQ